MNGKIEIKIDNKGVIRVDTIGIHGVKCLEEVNDLLEELVLITDVKKTDSFDFHVHIHPREKEVIRNAL